MTAARPKNRGFVKTALAGAILLATALITTISFLGNDDDRALAENELTFSVVRSDFVSSIIESGDVASSRNVDIRCRVRERGGTAISKIVDEGTLVKEGDFLAQLEDSTFRDEVVERKIRVAEDRASVIQAQSNLTAAKRSLREFENGQFAQELATYEAEFAFAEENLRRARDYKKYSENLARKGYITKAQLEADRFAVVRAEKELQLAKSKLAVFRDFSQDRMEAELKAAIQQEEANLEASQFTLELSKQRLKYFEDQVAACYITAPADGQVVYANEIEGRGESGIVIEEGVTVREGQSIIRLPDPQSMQVTTKVNDSKINSIQPGQHALVRLDTAPEVPIRGIVREVANFPLPRRWSQAPIEYEVYVDIVENSDMVRPGLRAKVEVFVEQEEDALQVPVSALVERNRDFYVVVKSGDNAELRPVRIGPNNESMVIIREGLDEGELVLVDPDEFREVNPVENAGSDT
jgi:RND family efflux transporter MFP subunit